MMVVLLRANFRAEGFFCEMGGEASNALFIKALKGVLLGVVVAACSASMGGGLDGGGMGGSSFLPNESEWWWW